MTHYFRSLSTLLLAGALLGGAAARVLAQATRPGTATLVIIPKKTDPNQLISFSFQQADIDDVLRFLADATGKIVFKDPAVSLSVTIRNQSRIKVSDAITLVQRFLSLKGFALVETPDALIATTAPEARTRRSTDVSTGKALDTIPKGNGIITHIFPLQNVDATRLREELQPLFPTGAGILVADADTNSLIVVDEADNVRRVAQIIQLVDRDLADEIQVEVIHLMYVDATEMARYLTDLFRPDETARPQQQPANPFAAPGATAAQPRSGLQQLRGRVRFAADTHSNSLLVYASPANIKTVRELIARLDVNMSPRVEYRIVPLKYADATALADQLTQLTDAGAQSGNNRGGGGFFGFGGGGGNTTTRNPDPNSPDNFRVVPDVRINSLIITAPVDRAQSLEDLIRKLDQPSQVENVVRVFQLQNAIASEVATTLRNLFLGNQQQGNLGVNLFGAGQRTQIPPNSPLDLLRQVTIVPNDQTNQLLVSGPAQTFPVIEQLLSEESGLDRRLPQVFIEVVIADVTLDDELKFGVEWNAVAGNSTFGTNFGLTSPTADNTGFRYSVLSNNFQATLQALGTTNRLKVLSTPHVMVTDNSPALISIGENIPYAGETTVTNSGITTSTGFLDVAITLNVTPHISPGRHILMDIDQVVNSLIEFITIAPGQVAPRTTSRRAGTTVIVQNDQTVVLGGIISNNDTRKVQKVPFLGDLPVLGQFFRNTTSTKGRTELVVFITPHIVTDTEDADHLRNYERGRLKVDPLKRLEVPFAPPPDLKPQDLRPRRKSSNSTR